jgi:para-nitrobenzyl esterase
MMTRRILSIAMLALPLFCAACGDDSHGSAPTATAAPPTATPTLPLPSPTRTATVTLAPSPTPTSFASATPTVIPSPTATGTPADPLLVVTDTGPVRGIAADGVRRFLGIPYAAPPVGALRWRAPQPVAPWTDVRDATQPGNGCVQKIPIVNLAIGSEDCLFVNVVAPNPPPTGTGIGASKLAPVMVWIHGGGFTTGDGRQYTGSTEGGVIAGTAAAVVVSLNYRLGQFGFLAHRALSSEDAAHPGSGDYGLEDQIAALRWVQRNIAAFGGDPHNVTIFGESAGGWSVCIHLVSPEATGLFQHAIVESGLCVQPLNELGAAEQQGERFADALGCSGAPDVLACMRAKSADDVRAALPPDPNFAFTPGVWGNYFPVVDGRILPQQVAALLAQGSVQRVPLLIGSNGDEGTLFVALSHDNLGMPLMPDQYRDRLLHLVNGNAAAADAIEARYPLANYPTPGAALAAAFGDGFLACPTIASAELAAPLMPTYLYQFTYPDAGFSLPLPVALGAFHSAEVQFVFGVPASRPFTADEEELSHQMLRYWTRFAASGDPNGGSAASWPLLDDGGRYLRLDRTIEPGAHAKQDACDFWRGLNLNQTP